MDKLDVDKGLGLIYENFEACPEEANAIALQLLKLTDDQEYIDDINWARGYALVGLKKFVEAKDIWLDIFNRTKNHKALHQVGMSERAAGNYDKALKIFMQESELINEDEVAKGANLYELCYCSHLAGQADKAFQYFERYELLSSEDSTERGCFYRLKGDLYAKSFPHIAKDAYMQSMQFFFTANSEQAVEEVKGRLANLET